VGRIAKELGFPPGDDRRYEAAIRSKLEEWCSKVGTHPAIQKCKELGFVVEPMETFHPTLQFLKGMFRTSAEVEHVAKDAPGPRGKERRFYSATAAKMKEWLATTGHHPVARECRKMGFLVEPLERRGAQLRFLRTAIQVNGHSVAFAGLWVREEAPSGVICHLAPKQDLNVEFQIAHAQGMFYVFPQWALEGVKGTRFTTYYTRPKHRFTKSMRHDYQNYRDAWRLLGKPRKTPVSASEKSNIPL
jgi:hypothetical protein